MKTRIAHAALNRRQAATGLALALAALVTVGAKPAAAQTPAPITEDMVRRVPPPPRPHAELRVEVQPGTPPVDDSKARRTKKPKAAGSSNAGTGSTTSSSGTNTDTRP